MTSPSIAQLRATAEEGAKLSGAILAARFGGARTIEFKGGTGVDMVTDADKASEAALLGHLRSRYPDHAILAEESGLSQGRGATGYRWLVDPLDGTTNYAHDVPHFCVSVAVEGPQGLLAAAVLDPMRNELFSAGRGEGATLNGQPIRCSGITDLQRALLCTGFPYDVKARPHGPLGLLSRFLPQAQGMRRMGAAALDLCYVAAGRFDAYFEFSLKPWDVAGGALLILEAGGSMTHMDGSPLQVGEGNVLGAAPGIAKELLEQCREFLHELYEVDPERGRRK